jgi:uncharacterized protein YjiS (DUF1127 family)
MIMSHIRSRLNPDENFFQSTGTASPLPVPATAAAPGGRAHAGAAIAPAWRRTWQAIAQRLRAWRACHRARCELAQLDSRSLRELGIAPELVDYELSRPFWQPLRDWRS